MAGAVFTPLKAPTRTITNPILTGPFISTQERAAATKNILTSVTQKPAIGPLVLPKPYVAPKPVVQKNLTPLVTPKSSVPFQGRPNVTPIEQVQMKAAAPPPKQLLYQPGITPTFNAKGVVVKNPVTQATGLRTGLDYFNRYTETALSTVGAIADTYAGYAWNKDTWNIAKERIKNNFSQIWSPPALEEAGVPAAIGRAAGNALSLAGTIITTYTLGKALVDFEQQIALNARRVAYYGKLAGQNPEEAVPGIGAAGPAPKIASERSFAFTPDEMRQGVTSAMSRYGMTRQEATDLVNMFQEIAKTPYDKPSVLTYQSNAKEPGFAVGSAQFDPFAQSQSITQTVPTNLPAGQGDILGFVIQFPDIAVKTGVVASASAASQLATLTTQVMRGQAAVTNLQAAMTASIPNLGVLAHYADLTRQPINEVMAEQARLAVPVGQPVTTQQTVAPTPVRTAIPAQATAPVSRILPYAAEAPAVSSPVATISTRQLPVSTPAAPTTQPAAAVTKQPYSVDLPDGSRLTITPPAAQVAPTVPVTEKQPWQMTQDEYMNRRPIPAMQGKLPETGTHPAVETVDGSIFADASDTPATHVQMIRDLGIPPERLKSGGWIVDGVYEPTARSDTMKYAEQEQAKTRVEQKQVIRRALSEGKDVPSEVLASYPDLKTSPSAAISNKETGATTPVEVTAPRTTQNEVPAAPVKEQTAVTPPQEQTPAAVKPTIATDPLTGLGTSEAWQAVDKTDKTVMSVDPSFLLTSIKKYGPEFGDTLRVALGAVLKQEGIDAYHVNKVETAALFATPEEADTKMQAVQKDLADLTLHVDVNGKRMALSGLRWDYGIGDDKQSADADLAGKGLQSQWTAQSVRSPAVTAEQRQGNTVAANLALNIHPESSVQQQIAKNNATPWVAEGRQPTPRELLNGVTALGYTLDESSRQMFDPKELNKLPMLQRLFRKSGTKVIGLDELASVLSSEYGINRPQGDLQADDWLAQQLVAGASKGAGNATKDLFGGEIRTRTVAPAPEELPLAKGQPAFTTTAQKNAAERGGAITRANQRTEQVRQTPVNEGVFAGEVAGLPFNIATNNNANVTGVQANQPTTAGYEMNVTPSTGTTARTIAAEKNDIARITAVFDNAASAMWSGKLTPTTEGSYQKAFYDALVAAGVPKGALGWEKAITYYRETKNAHGLANRLAKVATIVEKYNNKVLAEQMAKGRERAQMLDKQHAKLLDVRQADREKLAQSEREVATRLKEQQTNDRIAMEIEVGRQKHIDRAVAAALAEKEANLAKTEEWLHAEKALSARNKAEIASIMEYIENLDLRYMHAAEAKAIQEEAGAAGIELKHPFVAPGDTAFVWAMQNVGLHVVDSSVPLVEQQVLNLPELRALQAKVKAIADLSKEEKDVIKTRRQEALNKEIDDCVAELSEHITEKNIPNVRTGIYHGPEKKSNIANALDKMHEVPVFADIQFDRQQYLFQVIGGYRKRALYNSLYNKIYGADRATARSVNTDIALAHERLVQSGITPKTMSKERTLSNGIVVTQRDVIFAAVYAGNTNTLSKMMESNGWTEEDIRLSIESMSKEEVAWTNYMLDDMRMLYPQVSGAFAEINQGASLPDIMNYFPAIGEKGVDVALGQPGKAIVHPAEQMTLDSLAFYGWGQGDTMAGGKPSFVKHREGGKMVLQVDPISSYFSYKESALDYINRAPVASSMRAIVADARFKDAFLIVAGEQRYKGLMEYVEAIANPSKALAPKNSVERAARVLRWNASAGTLSLRLSKAITAFMSYGLGFGRYSPTAMLYGTHKLMGDFHGSMAEIKQYAPLLYQRLVDPVRWDALIADAEHAWGVPTSVDTKRLANLGFAVGDTLDVASSFMGYTWSLLRQHLNDPAWTLERASYVAERDLLQTHTSRLVQDRPAIYRGTELGQALVAFTGEATSQSMALMFDAKSAYHGKTPKAKFIAEWFTLTMGVALMGMLADAVARGRKKKTAKESGFWDGIWGRFIEANIETFIPIAGRWITGSLRGFTGANDIITLKAIDEVKQLIPDIIKGNFGKATMHLLRFVGFGVGIPVLGFDELKNWINPDNAASSSSTTIQKPSKPTKPTPAVQKPHK